MRIKCENKRVKIAVIDSGVCESSYVENNILQSYVLVSDNNIYSLRPSKLVDYIGHGTAITNIICKENNHVDILNFRVCDKELCFNENGLVYILNYILNNVEVDIINISLGCIYLENYEEMNLICNKLSNKGIIIVSAFDNVVSDPFYLRSLYTL